MVARDSAPLLRSLGRWLGIPRNRRKPRPVGAGGRGRLRRAGALADFAQPSCSISIVSGLAQHGQGDTHGGAIADAADRFQVATQRAGVGAALEAADANAAVLGRAVWLDKQIGRESRRE